MKFEIEGCGDPQCLLCREITKGERAMTTYPPTLARLMASIPGGGWVHEAITGVLPSISVPGRIIVQTQCGSLFLFWLESDLHGYLPEPGVDRLSAFVRHPEQGDTKWQSAYVVVIGEQLVWDASN